MFNYGNVVVKEDYEIVAIAENGFYSSRYCRKSYDAVIRRCNATCGKYVVASDYCLEDGSWSSGKYFDNFATAMKEFSFLF